MYNELLLDAVDFSLDFCFLVKGDGGCAMLFNFLIGGVGEVPEDDEVAGLPLKLFLLGVSACESVCKLNCFWKLVFLPRFLPCILVSCCSYGLSVSVCAGEVYLDQRTSEQYQLE